jgi:hypothetical protein
MKLFEEFKLYENMWDNDSVDEKVLDACLSRIDRASRNEILYDEDFISIPVNLSKEDLKKALKIGSRGTYNNPKNGKTVPAQLVDSVFLSSTFDEDTGEVSSLGLSLGDDSVEEYCNDLVVVGEAEVPELARTFSNINQVADCVNTKIYPKADKIAHEIIEQAWANSGFTDFTGITDYNYKELEESSTSKIYIVFNYYPIKYSSGYSLDSFYLHAVSADKNKIISNLKEEALYRVQNLNSLDNTLVCYLIDPIKYDCTTDEFIKAAGKGGQDLHFESKDIVYALSSIVDSETPLYQLSMGDIQFLYEEYIEMNSSTLGFDVDDFYTYSGVSDPDVKEILDKDPNFEKFITNRLLANIATTV